MIYMYMHAGSLNHGCEAIVRSTIALTNGVYKVFSEKPQEDFSVGLDRVCHVISQGHSRNKKSLGFIAVKALELIFGSKIKYEYLYKNIFSVHKKSLFLSIGGDNYCYDNNRNLAYINKKLHMQGHTTGLWGCSIEPATIKNNEVLADLKLYDFITARESITYNALIEAGLSNVFLFPDTAFLLKGKKIEHNESFFDKKVVGINISPLVENIDRTGLLMKNYEVLIQWIIDNTDYNIALIPHVCKPGNDDRIPMYELLKKFNTNRMMIINIEGKLNCEELKYIIGKCNIAIVARTHASIAAYSQMIPTIVVGYSIKAIGIAKDIFVDTENLLIDSRNLKSDSELLRKFLYVLNHRSEIKNKLDLEMNNYINRAKLASKIIEKFER